MAKSIKDAAELFAEEKKGVTVNTDTQWAMTEEADGIHVRPFVDGEVIMDTPIETYEDYRESNGVDEEVSEEVVQAVAEAIVEQAIEDDKTVEEIVEEICDESKGQYIPMEDDNAKIKVVFPTRGFKSLKDAKDWTKSSSFASLGKADQEEFLTWLKNIK